MAHILTIIPKGIWMGKRVQALSCLENDKKNIQQRLDCAAKLKQKLDADIFERNKKIEQNSKAKI